MIDLLFTCEHADWPHGCENAESMTIDFGIRLDSGAAQAVIDSAVSLPEGWTTVDERGAPRLRCPEHSNATEPLR